MADLVHPGDYGRKHKLSSLEPPRAKKRVRLEAMLESLSLGGSRRASSPVYINPLAIHEKSQKKQKRNDIDSIISGKLYECYKQDLLRGFKVIRYKHPVAIIMWRFKSWIKRLFNVFITKYNRQNPHVQPMKTFRDYAQIMALVEDKKVNFSLADLLHIVVQESGLEVKAIERKREMSADSTKLQEIKEEEDVVKQCNYHYWDRLRTRPADVDMDILQGPELPADMELDEPSEANYGNYYSLSM